MTLKLFWLLIKQFFGLTPDARPALDEVKEAILKLDKVREDANILAAHKTKQVDKLLGERSELFREAADASTLAKKFDSVLEGTDGRD